MGTTMLWVGFNAAVLVMLAIDLGVLHREARKVSLREAGIWTAVWIGTALLFNLGLYYWVGADIALEFLTGYLIEKSLSVDNICVFLMIFAYFQVPDKYQHRVLFWGILGALIMRGIFIAVGATLLARFHWIIYIFGGFLFFTGFKMAVQEESEPDPESNPLIRFVRRFFPCTEGYEGEQFFVRRSGVLYATPLLLVLIMVETTDLVFALDSIPAIFAVTRDPFLVYTSNVFAILGLRALYFLLAGVLGMFHYLQQGLAAILMFVGVKMLLLEVYKIPTVVSLGVIFGILTISIVASMIRRSRLQDDPGLVSGEGCQLNRDNCGISISGKCRVDRKVSSAETDTSDGLDRDRSRPAAGDGAE